MQTKTDTRTTILNTALDLFYSKGYDAVGVQEIAEKSGITKPTLYYYFGSKAGLLETLLQTEVAPLIALLEGVIAKEESVPDILLETAAVYCNFATQNYKFYRFLISILHVAPENETYQIIRPIATSIHYLMVDLFSRRGHILGNMNGRQTQFALSYVGTLNQYLIYHFETTQGKPKKITTTELSSLMQQFMYGIFS